MTQATRREGNSRSRRGAQALLIFFALLLLWIVQSWQNEHRDVGLQTSTRLGFDSFDVKSAWRQTHTSSWFGNKQNSQDFDFARVSPDGSLGVAGGVIGGAIGAHLQNVQMPVTAPQPPQQPEDAERMVIRTGTLQIIAVDPSHAAEQLRHLATRLSGFVVTSTISGSDHLAGSAQVTLRIPAQYFDQARAQVRSIAKSVEQDTVEARDVTRDYVDREATLRNARAEEAQYLAILKHSTLVKDVLEVTSQLAEVRGRIEVSEADQRLLRHQVQMSLLTANIRAVPQAQAFGLNWRPLYQARLALRGALVGLADYADSMVAFFLNLPVLLIWVFTVVALLKLGWIGLRRIVLAFFPGLTALLRSSPTAQPM
jgi:hypothetical protein